MVEKQIIYQIIKLLNCVKILPFITFMFNLKLIDNYFYRWSILQNKNGLTNELTTIRFHLYLQEIAIASHLLTKLFFICTQSKLDSLTNQLLFNQVYIEGFEDHFNVWLAGGLLLSLYCHHSLYRDNFGACGQLLYHVLKNNDKHDNKKKNNCNNDFFLHSYFTRSYFGIKFVTMPITLFTKKLSQVLIIAFSGLNICNCKH